MFARVLTVHLKPGQGTEFSAAMDAEAVPLLRKFAGFRDQMTLVSPDGTQAFAISFWDTATDAEAYRREGYSEVRKSMDRFTKEAPDIATYDVTNSTAHHIRAAVSAAPAR